MSRKQWGHGYWAGRRSMADYRPMTGLLMGLPRIQWGGSVWRWGFRHCWYYQVTHPLKIDRSFIEYGILGVTLLGFWWEFRWDV